MRTPLLSAVTKETQNIIQGANVQNELNNTIVLIANSTEQYNNQSGGHNTVTITEATPLVSKMETTISNKPPMPNPPCERIKRKYTKKAQTQTPNNAMPMVTSTQAPKPKRKYTKKSVNSGATTSDDNFSTDGNQNQPPLDVNGNVVDKQGIACAADKRKILSDRTSEPKQSRPTTVQKHNVARTILGEGQI